MAENEAVENGGLIITDAEFHDLPRGSSLDQIREFNTLSQKHEVSGEITIEGSSEFAARYFLEHATPPVTDYAAQILGTLNNVEAVVDNLIERIPTLSDEEVIAARTYAIGMGRAAFRIECAADAEIFKRTTARAGGRGKKDTDGKGIQKTLASIAQENNTSESTIRNNAAIYNNLLADEEVAALTANLDQKQFFTEAMRAPDPKAAVLDLAKRKAVDPGYNTRQAHADVETMRGVNASATPRQEADWRQAFRDYSGKLLLLAPDGFFPSYMAAIQKAHNAVLRVGKDGKPEPEQPARGAELVNAPTITVVGVDDPEIVPVSAHENTGFAEI